MSSPIVGLSNQELPLLEGISSQAAVAPPPTTSFDNLLNQMLAPDAEGQVNEEQLFSALIGERLTSLKGPEAAEVYRERFAQYQSEMQREDGYVPIEVPARKALESLAADGMLGLEEAEAIHAQAFQAAQFDNNSAALYDSYGSLYDQTIAVTMVELALESAKQEIAKFDSGEAQAGRMAFNLDFDQPLAAAEPVNQAGAAAPGLDDGNYASGLISKPITDSTGAMVMILPSSLQGNIEAVSIKDSSGKILEQGNRMVVDEKGRSLFGFDRPGAQYPDNLTVMVSLANGESIKYFMPDPGARVGY